MARTCVICGASIEHKNAHAKYCSPLCRTRSAAYKRTKANYAKSAEGKAAMKKYQSSPKGKAAAKRYQQSPKGKTAQKRSIERHKQKADAVQDVAIERDLARQL